MSLDAKIDHVLGATRVVVAPTVHRNGTSKSSLLVEYEEAIEAVREAITQVGHTAPNNRDYYVQGPTVIDEATRQHVERLKKLQAVLDELQAIWAKVDEQ